MKNVPMKHRLVAMMFLPERDSGELAQALALSEAQGYDRARSEIAALFDAHPAVKRAILEHRAPDLPKNAGEPAEPPEPQAEREERGAGPEHAAEILARHRGNVSSAAREARVPRTTFRAWLSKPPALLRVAS